MTKYKLIYLIIGLFISKTSFSDSFSLNSAKKSLSEKIQIIQLENGLRVLLLKTESSKTVALFTKVMVGSADENDQNAGTSHFLEHLLFKGTKNIGTKNFDKEEKYIEQIKCWGNVLDTLKIKKRDLVEKNEQIPQKLEEDIHLFTNRLDILQELHKEFMISNEDATIYSENGQVGFNAYTTNDVTNYQIELPSNRLEIWAKLESDRLLNPIFREYYQERDVVFEERRMRIDNSAFGTLREQFISHAFDSHPYQKPVIGYPSNLPFLNYDETEQFFQTYYTPQNIVIAIVGDIDYEKTKNIIKKYFSPIPKRVDPTRQPAKENFNKGFRKFQIEYPSGPLKFFAWNKPSFPDPDDISFEVLSYILTDGPSSRLYKSLVIEKQLATNVNSWNGDPGQRYSNLFSIYVTSNFQADPIEIENVIFEEIKKVQEDLVLDSELFKVKNKLLYEFYSSLQSNEKLADYLSYYNLVFSDWKEIFNYYDDIEKLTPEDIQKSAKKYLNKENLTIGELKTK